MTSLVAQSSAVSVAANGLKNIPVAIASSLALSIFHNARNDNANLHAPQRQRKNYNGLSVRVGSSTAGNPMIQFYHTWLKLPQIFRFSVAGNLANLVFFYLEKVIFRMLSHILVTSSVLSSILLDGIEKYQDEMSYFSAYVIQIVSTHLFYAFIVYGVDTIDTYEKYSKTLLGQFKVYGFGLFGATFLNSYLMTSGGLSKTLAFWTTTMICAVFNYFLVS